MPLTRQFSTTIKARADRDPVFRQALLGEALESFLAGDTDGGKAALRTYVNATLGFETLADATGLPSKSLHRMLSPEGNPTTSNFFAILGALQQRTGVRLTLTVASLPRRRRTAQGTVRA